MTRSRRFGNSGYICQKHHHQDTTSVHDKQQRRLELVHIPKTVGSALEIAAAKAGLPWSFCHFRVRFLNPCQTKSFVPAILPSPPTPPTSPSRSWVSIFDAFSFFTQCTSYIQGSKCWRWVEVSWVLCHNNTIEDVLWMSLSSCSILCHPQEGNSDKRQQVPSATKTRHGEYLQEEKSTPAQGQVPDSLGDPVPYFVFSLSMIFTSLVEDLVIPSSFSAPLPSKRRHDNGGRPPEQK